MKITNCKVNHLTNPIGFQMNHIVFSWVVEDADGLNPFELPVPLSPRTRYCWELTILTPKHDTEVFECGWFETGKMDEPWMGSWISCDSFPSRHPIFYKNFSVDSWHVKRSNITASGIYDNDRGFGEKGNRIKKKKGAGKLPRQ